MANKKQSINNINQYNYDRNRSSDLRESGAIEQGADAEFSFAKYREGFLETIGIHFDGNKVKYSDQQEYDEYANDIPKMNPNDDENFYDA